MIKNKRVIGVCLTKIHDSTRADYINRLHHLANRLNYKIIVFNCFVDFYNNDSFDKGAKAIYDIINYDMIDALIIHSESFCSRNVIEEIIDNAKAHNTPVVLINSTEEGCFSVLGDYDEPFKAVINHILKDHGITDTFFIAGNKDGDKVSEHRIQCYKEALAENGIPFDENRIAYGEYWDGPTERAVHELVKDGKKPPRAIICANDYMAFAVCNELKKNGYKVPEDVIVTGFDGVPASEHFEPRLTTCAEDLEKLAVLSLEAVTAAFDKQECRIFKNQYVPRICESCGCKKLTPEDFRDVAAELYNVIDDIQNHEDFMYSCINDVIDIRDMNDLHSSLSKSILENSYVCLNSNFVASIIETNEKMKPKISDELIIIPSRYSYSEKASGSKMKLSELVPRLEEWADGYASYILTAIYVGSEVCGYYAFRTDNIIAASNKIKRVLNTVNIAFNVAISHFRQVSMRLSIQRAAVVNSLTQLPNLKGSIVWFDEFATPENRERTISVSVYGLPKYTYILENYGIAAAEEAISFVAEALKLANTENCYIGHIAEDEFIIINYYNSFSEVSDTINKATSVFFSIIESYNSKSEKEYYVEVNCGCTVLEPGWDGTLESFIKFANSEMYMNRLKSRMGPAVKEENAPKEYYKAFDLLIEKNLFNYHFQPIVSAKNGDIYAYEALMRTDVSIGMSPLDVLNTAKEYNRLYEIEKATMFNVMNRFTAEIEKFKGKKIFINTIPGFFLKGSDLDELIGKYSEYMNRFVFELTEQNTVTDEELNFMRQTKDVHIAIDDYGTGHSNIVNLIRYTPHVIKIDRYLITDIHKNQNKQLFVRSTIEFARLNNILVLAEGVETSNELHTVIDLGVDLIQGYYTGRPAPEPIPFIADEIRKEIIEANPLFAQ